MLHDFLMAYGGNVCISIVGFCEEAEQSEVMTSDWYKKIKTGKLLDGRQSIKLKFI